MGKFLLTAGIWIATLSWVIASDTVATAIPFGSSYILTVDQDAPVYPNPARDHIFFRLSDGNVATDDFSIEIRNILGNKMPVRLERTNSDTYRINLNNYPSGYYLLVLQCEQCGSEQGRHEEIHKFLKQ